MSGWVDPYKNVKQTQQELSNADVGQSEEEVVNDIDPFIHKYSYRKAFDAHTREESAGGNGHEQAKEMKEVIEARRLVKKLVQKYDQNKDGYLTWNEIRNGMLAQNASESLIEVARKKFLLMDRDGDGNKAVSLKELEAFLTLDDVELQRSTNQTSAGRVGKGSGAIAIEDDSKLVEDELAYPGDRARDEEVVLREKQWRALSLYALNHYDPVLGFARRSDGFVLQTFGSKDEALAAYAALPEANKLLTLQGTVVKEDYAPLPALPAKNASEEDKAEALHLTAVRAGLLDRVPRLCWRAGSERASKRASSGMTFSPVFAGTIRENIDLLGSTHASDQETDEKVWEILKNFGIHATVKRNGGLDSQVLQVLNKLGSARFKEFAQQLVFAREEGKKKTRMPKWEYRSSAAKGPQAMKEELRSLTEDGVDAVLQARRNKASGEAIYSAMGSNSNVLDTPAWKQ